MKHRNAITLSIAAVMAFLLGTLILGKDIADLRTGMGNYYGPFPPTTGPFWPQMGGFLLFTTVHYWPLTVAFVLSLIGILRSRAPKWMLTALAVCMLAPAAMSLAVRRLL